MRTTGGRAGEDATGGGGSATRAGLVVRTAARVHHVEIDGEVRPCAPMGRLFEDLGHRRNPIAVGDRVRVELSGDPPGIVEVLPRDNWLSRVASAHDPREQVLLANVDQLVVVGSLGEPRFSSSRTDRILAACAWHEIEPVLVLNKLDLDGEGELEPIRETYERAGARVVPTCAVDGRGLDALADVLRGRTSGLYGPSGAGKSTLLNALEPNLDLKTGKVSRYWDAGRHTTSFSEMHRLDSLDARVIDTPGIRVFRPYGVRKGDLWGLFPDIAAHQGRCRFPNCTHDHEPDCAVFDAVEAGELPPSRYASYVEILDELEPPPDDDEYVVPPEG